MTYEKYIAKSSGKIVQHQHKWYPYTGEPGIKVSENTPKAISEMNTESLAMLYLLDHGVM